MQLNAAESTTTEETECFLMTDAEENRKGRTSIVTKKENNVQQLPRLKLFALGLILLLGGTCFDHFILSKYMLSKIGEGKGELPTSIKGIKEIEDELTSKSLLNTNATTVTEKGVPSKPREYVHPNIIYGHVHIAKTGGTSLNGILANKFERVCGNKGITYSAYASNELAKEKLRQNNTKYDANPLKTWVGILKTVIT